MDEYDEFTYFASPIYRVEKPEWVEPLSLICEEYYNQSENYYKSIDRSCELIQTPSIQNNNRVSFLRDYIIGVSKDISIHQGYDITGYNFSIEALWAQQINPGGYHVPHVHSLTTFSGIFVLESPNIEGCSYPVFEDPRPGKLMCDMFFDYNNNNNLLTTCPSIHFNNLINGTLLFFNSWLPHKFTVNKSSLPLKFLHFCVSAKLKTL